MIPSAQVRLLIIRGAFALLLAVTAHVPLSFSQVPVGPSFPLRLSADGRYVVDQNNRPFFVNGDTAWSLIVQLSQANADAYLSDRALKGFNLVLVNLIDRKFASNAPANLSGQPPFSVAGSFSTPNEAYFAHADWVINKAAEKGITVLLAPLYLGYGCGSEGWCNEVKASSFATMRNYGRYIGNRYKGFPNIIWLIGGDADPVANGVADKVREFVAGLKEYDSLHLITAHNSPEQAAMDVWATEAWLTLNNVYTYNDSYPKALAQYNRTGAKPFFLMETYYENEHDSTAFSVRRQAYWAVLSGGLVGHVFGNCPIWHFNAPAGSTFCAAGTWQSQLNSSGSATLAHLGRLFGSRAFQKLVPDQAGIVLTSGVRTGSELAVAARASDGSLVIAYIPSGRTVTVNLSQVAGTSARAWWFNPRTAQSSIIGDYSTTGTGTFVSPDASDWVLVLDGASLNLPAPGLPTGQIMLAPTNLRVLP